MQVTSGSSLRSRPGIGIVVVAIVLVIVVVVAGGAAYYVLVASSASTSTSQSSTQTPIATSSSPSTTSSHTSSTSFSIRSTTTTGSSAVKTYSGSFNFSVPLGPAGELVYSNNTVKTFTSVQVASGSFTFSIDPSRYSGSGSGHGTLTVTTTGFCSGRTTIPYTFLIPDVTNFPGQNITVFIGTPTPANFTVPLTCTATPTQGSTNGNTFPFLSTYPNEFVVAAVPVSVSQHLSGNITYWFTIQ